MIRQQAVEQNPPSTITIAQFVHLYTGPNATVIQVPPSVQTTTLVVGLPPSTTLPGHPRRQSTVVGTILIAIGCLSIVFNIVDLVVNADGEISSLGVIGHGIWSGTAVVAFLALSIFSSVTCLSQLCIGLAGCSSAANSCHGDGCDKAAFLMAMEALLAVLGLAGGITSVSGAVICCKAGVCCETTSGQVATVQVVPNEKPLTFTPYLQPESAVKVLALNNVVFHEHIVWRLVTKRRTSCAVDIRSSEHKTAFTSNTKALAYSDINNADAIMIV